MISNKSVILFGNKDFASLAHFYLREDSDFNVAAFSISGSFIAAGETSFEGKPLLPFEELENLMSPDDYDFFAPMSPANMNSDRQSIYEQIHFKGYSTISYISSKATLFSNSTIGNNCFILENNTIQPFVNIGNNCVIWSGNHIGHHSLIEDNVFLSSHVVVSGHCRIGANSFLGVNSTLNDGIQLAPKTFVCMATSVSKSSSEGDVIKSDQGKILKFKSHKIR